MRKIDKGAEPQALTRFKQANPARRYDKDFPYEERHAIRQACTTEQFYLCAYCCAAITGDRRDTMNEHLLCRQQHPQSSLDFDNIVASCTHKGQCDSAKANRSIALTPLMLECETELRFMLSGRVEGRTQRAVETIEALNLGGDERDNKRLVQIRQDLARTLLTAHGPFAPVEDDDLLQVLIDDLATPIDGKLSPYAPVLNNILRGWLDGGHRV